MIAENGMNFWFPVSCSANFAMCAACVAVFIKAKNVKTKSLALPAGLSASLGITEPAIFGINLRYVKPLVCGMVGAAFGAAFGTIVGVYGSAYGVTGIPGFLITTDCTMQYTIMLLIAGGISFVLTYMLWKEDMPEAETAATVEKTVETKWEPGTIICPVKGVAVANDQIPDETFASGALGGGVGIEPEEGIVVAPCDGEISSIADSKHAIGITSADGMEILIHVGIDTVAMNGKGFQPQVSQGDQVKAGQVIMKFSIEEIKRANYPAITAVLLTNSDDYSNFKVIKTGKVSSVDTIMTV